MPAAAGRSEQIDRVTIMVGVSSSRSRCGCCVTSSDVVRNRNNNVNDAPDAVLEGLAMAGLVAILRQLGDLAELAAEVLDDLQDQVMAASARGRRLAVRAKRLLEADLDLMPPPPSSTHSAAAAPAPALALTITTSGSGTVPLPPMPRLVVQRIRRCRGPPSLSLLDKFDAAGEGACLKRYTDPSFFFRAHSASRLEQGTIRFRANRGPYLKSMSMSMESSRPKFQTALLNSEPPESAHTDSPYVSVNSFRSETDASPAGFFNMLRQLKQHRQAAGAGSVFRMQQTAVDRVQSSPQLNMENKLQLQGGGTAQPSPSPSPSELERTSSFEAWLSPDAHSFTAAATTNHHHEHDENITQEPPAPLGSSTMLIKGAGNKSRSRRYKGSSSVEMIASRVSSLPRKLFINIKHHCSDDRAGTSLRISQATGIGDCSPQLPTPTPRAREAFLLHSNPVYSSIIPSTDQCSNSNKNSNSNSNSSTPESCGDRDLTCTPPPDDSKNLLLPGGSLVLKRAGALPPDNSCSEDAKVDDTTTPPLPPIPLPPMQWLSEKVHTGGPLAHPRAASPKHRALWGKSLEVDRADRSSNGALHSASTQQVAVAETIQATSHSIQTSPVESLVSANNVSHSHRDEMKCSESEETRHPQPSRGLESSFLKAGELFPALLSDEDDWPVADTCLQQRGRRRFVGSSGHSDAKRSQEHEASSDDTSNLQNESVFFSAVQELAKMSPPPPSVPWPKYSLLDAGSHGRITLRNGPSLIHPSRNILDSRGVLIQHIKDIAMAGNPSFKLKPVSAASSPVSVTGSPSPTNSKVATILQRADDIRQAHANSNDLDSEESWSDDSE